MILRIDCEDVTVHDLAVDSEDFGDWHRVTNTIGIAPYCDPRTRALTLLHEVLHAMSDIRGLNLSERVVLNLEHALGSFIRDNPTVFRGMVESIITGEKAQ